VKCLEIAVMKA